MRPDLEEAVLDAHQIYRRGLTSCLETADGIDGVADAGSVAEAWQHAPEAPQNA